jgi:hypothetical protein
MVKFNPRNKGNKPGIAIMIAVKPPKKGKKIKKNLWEDLQDIEEMERRGIDTSFMSRENPNPPPPNPPKPPMGGNIGRLNLPNKPPIPTGRCMSCMRDRAAKISDPLSPGI